MAKDAPLAFRISSELKTKLQEIASNEGRSLSQVCELLLAAGVSAYEKEGTLFVRKIVTNRKK